MKKIGWLLGCCCTLQTALGQVSDDFTDGNFTTNPVWAGDDAKFEVAAQRLHLNDISETGQAFLSTPSEAISTAEWRFSLEISVNPSGSNYASFYLVADQADLSGDVNGYFVKIGGMNDEVSLFRQDGSTQTLIIDGADGRVDTSPVQIEVKVMRDDQGNWELSSRPWGDTDFSLEGSVLDVTYQTSAYVGVYCQYTPTRKDAFYFDDILVTGTPQPDTRRPQVAGMSVLSDTQLSVQFSEEVTSTTGGTAANYILAEHTITDAVVAGDAVTLTVHPALENATGYELSVRNIEDEAGNRLTDTTLAFFHFEAVPVQWNDVVISELMPDPNPVKDDLPDAEYIELYNRSDHPFDLQGWTLNGKSLPEYILYPQQYVILCAAGDSSLLALYGDVVLLGSWPSLSNSGTRLVLQDGTYTTLDSLGYSVDEVVGGISLERIREESPCDQRTNLALSLADRGGTPGQANTVTNAVSDTTGPRLLQVAALNKQQLQLVFDERVSEDQLQPSSIILHPSLTIADVQRDTADGKNVWVSCAEALQHGTTYSVAFLNAQDCYGNTEPTQTRSFYFDNQPPALVQTVVLDTAIVQLLFSEKVDAAIAAEKDYYWMDSAGNTPRSVVVVGDSTSIILGFSVSFADGAEHQLTVLTLQDSYGNVADSLTTTFVYQQAIDTVMVISEYQLDVYLSEEVSAKTGSAIENFEIDRGVGHPYTSFVDGEQPNLLHWVLRRPLTANQEHKLSISSLYDAQHTLLSTPVYRFYYDRRPPGLDSVVAVNERTLWVYFDEALSPSLASQVLHYQLEPQGSTIIQAALQDNQRVVQLTLDAALTPETEHELQVLGLADLSGNVISSSKRKSFIYDLHPPQLLSWKIVNPYQLRLYFSEAIAASGSAADYILESVSSPDSLTVSGIRPQEVRLFFTDPLQFDTANLTIRRIADVRGNSVAQPLKIQLTHTRATLGELTVLSPTELRLDFTQAIAEDVMRDPAVYRLDHTYPPAAVNLMSGRPYALLLTFSQPFQPDVTYPLSIDRIVNAQGISSAGVQDSFRYQTQVEYLETEAQALLIRFRVPVDSSIAVQVSRYKLEDDHPVAALQVDERTVRLVFARHFEPLTRYTLTLSGLQTIDRDLIPGSVHTVGLGRTPVFNELLITEVMADPLPVVGLPDAEYLELYNASPDLLSTASLHLSDATSTALLPSTLLLPGEYLIVSAAADHPAFAAYGRGVGLSNFPSLNSTGDHLQLSDAYGQEIFSVQYDDGWYNDAEKKQGGWSLEMVDPTRPCGEQDNWAASVADAGGTPGQANSVYHPNPDTKAPFLTEAFAVSDAALRLRFSEKPDPASISQARFSLSHGLTADSMQWAEDRKTVQLVLSNLLQPQVTYTVQVDHLTDCSGNRVDSSPRSFVLSETARLGDVLLSELLFYPRAGGVRFVEIYNASDRHINLKGWQLANPEGDSLINRKLISAEDYLLAPHQYLALTEDIPTLLGDYPAAPEERLLTLAGLPSLPAGSGALLLISPSGEQMQMFGYDERFHHPVLEDVRGVSLERIHWDAPVNDPNNWQSAARTVGYATPGYANSQARKSVISQAALSVEPRVFTPDQDGFQDYTQLHYRWVGTGNVANVLIFDSRGRKVKHLARNTMLAEEGFLRWDGTDDAQQLVPMGYYLIYFEVFHTNGQVSVLKERVAVGKPF